MRIKSGGEKRWNSYTARCLLLPFWEKRGQHPNTNKDWIQRLWKDFNEHSVEISQLALRDEQGNLAGFWGAMTNFDRTFQPWGNHLTEGYYLAGVQVPIETEAPEGWTKWIIPAFDYLYVPVGGRSSEVLRMGLDEIKKQGPTLAGAIQNFTVRRKNSEMFLFFPVC